ncbi:MAG: radical SAM family heme chaperone HemW [Rhodospirillaceae bacterium]
MSTKGYIQASDKDNVALYIHWPFCVSKCPYCDFNSHVVEHVDHGAWHEALLRELAFEAQRTDAKRLHSIFFGGGTPSLMHANTVRAIIDEAKALWRFGDNLEITIEANPGTADSERFFAFKEAGINRLSLGVQSLDAKQLEFLGREHSPSDAMHAIALAGDSFDHLSFDLIYARPGQTKKEWRNELLRALDVLKSAGGTHLSCYQLTIEENTPFKRDFENGLFSLPDEDMGAALFNLTQDILNDAGMPAYEISNHAQPGSAGRHNTHVWKGGMYVGIGPGAHGRTPVNGMVHSIRKHKPPAQWLKNVLRQGHSTLEDISLKPKDRGEEMVMLGLRLTEGLDLTSMEQQTGLPRYSVISRDSLKALESGGLVVCSSGRLCVTRRGRLVLNSIIEALLLHVD